VAAARALVKVDEGAHVEEVLAKIAPTDPRDRGLAWFLALGVLRRRGQIDAALREVLDRPLGELDAPVRATLRIGTLEALFGRAAPHAVVHEAVEVAKTIGVPKASGFVNAVLRKVRAAPDLARHDALDHPAWLHARWCERYGVQVAESWMAANNEPAPLTVVTRGAGDEVVAAWRAAGLEVSPAMLGGVPLARTWRIDAHEGAVPTLPGFAEGRFWVQDPAAVAVADLAKTGPGTRALDACAAPGGKSFRLRDAGADVTAVDVVGSRLQKIRDGSSRLGLALTLRHHDWREGPLPDPGGPFDVVLVDAPCSGLGTLRRHPEIRWRRQPTDVLRAAQEQAIILEHASAHVRGGGALVYAVCSPEPDEGSQIIKAFLGVHPEFRLEATLTTSPPELDEDAHQAFRLRKEGT
jgi:16S rRNA (cytosine967-C5)-methyltransferase